MKRKLIIPILIGISLLVSCGNLTFPKKASIKTDAKFKFTVAKLDLDLAEYLSPEKLLPQDPESTLEIYDYNPPSNTEGIQQLMVRMPIQDIPLDFSSFLSSTDIGTELEAISQEQTIQIPAAGFKQSQTITVSELQDMVNSCFAIECSTPAEYVDVELIGGSFESIKYKSGALHFDFGGSINGTIEIVSGSKVLASNTINGKTCDVDISNVLIPATAKIRIVLNNPSDNLYPFIATIADGSVCESVKKLNVDTSAFDEDDDPTKTSISTSVDLSALDSSIESITLGEGSDLTCEMKLPSGVKGISIASTFKLTNGTTFNVPANGSLDGFKLDTSKALDIDGEAQIQINNADITFEKDLEVVFDLHVYKMKEVVMSVGSLPTTISVNQTLPAEAKDMINSITWAKGSGIKITYTNSFPEGNDFTLKNVKSDFLKIGPVNATLAAASNRSLLDISVNESDLKTVINSSTSIDFTATLGFPGGKTDKIIAKDLTAGTIYKIGIKAEPVINWEKIEVKNNLASMSSNLEVSFNKESLFKDIDQQLGTSLATSVNLNALPMYLYCEVPGIGDVFTNPRFNGLIKATIGKKSGDVFTPKAGVDPVYLLGSAGDVKADMDIEHSAEKPLVKNDEGTVISEVTGNTTADLKDLVNKTGEGDIVNIYYDLSFESGNGSGSIEIEKSKLSKATATTISVTAVLILPLDIEITADQVVDVMEITGKKSSDPNWDLFARTEQPNKTRIEELLDVVEYVKVRFRPDSVPFTGSSELSVNIDMDGAGAQFEERSIVLAKDKCEFQLDEPIKLLSLYPVQPTVNIKLPEGRLAFKRATKISSPIDIIVRTNGTSELFGGE